VAKKVTALFKIGLLGIDFLVAPKGKKHWIIEVSPDMAISPPEGARNTG
jgi:D-alanine-D-alanine ligase-like ATP-grasp enzyme